MFFRGMVSGDKFQRNQATHFRCWGIHSTVWFALESTGLFTAFVTIPTCYTSVNVRPVEDVSPRSCSVAKSIALPLWRRSRKSFGSSRAIDIEWSGSSSPSCATLVCVSRWGRFKKRFYVLLKKCSFPASAPRANKNCSPNVACMIDHHLKGVRCFIALRGSPGSIIRR